MEAHSSNGHNRRRRLGWALALGLTALLSLGWAYAHRLQTNAEKLAQTGQAAQQIFKLYGYGLEHRDLDEIVALYAEDYAGQRDGFWQQRVLSERDGITVYAWQVEEPVAFAREDIRRQLEKYLGDISALEQSKLKLDSVEQMHGDKRAVVRSFMWLRGALSDGRTFESKVLFRMGIRQSEDEWKIHSQELLHGRTVVGDRSGFSDITASAGLDFESRLNPDWYTDEWYPKTYQIVKYALGGVSTADYDRDGWDDLFFSDSARARLFRNRGDGTFRDATIEAGLPDDLNGISVALFADLDNDGDADLFLGSGTTKNRLYRNEGDGTFVDVSQTVDLGGNLVSVASAADYDNDGLLDLYIGRYLDPRINLPTTLFYTRNSAGNSLLRNLGDLRFADVTERAGVRDGGLTLGTAWGDIDDDGDDDLYVANDFGRNGLYRNEGDGTFAEIAAGTDAIDFGFSMSASFADVDNDGDLDLYTSNVHSGQRWYGQAATLYQYLINSVLEGTATEDVPTYLEIFDLAGSDWHAYGDQMTKGNSLLINDGSGHFHDVSEETHSNPFGWYWSSAIFDYDNDGRQDIYGVNGWITAASKDDL